MDRYRESLQLAPQSTQEFVKNHVLARRLGQMWDGKVIGKDLPEKTEHTLVFPVLPDSKRIERMFYVSLSF